MNNLKKNISDYFFIALGSFILAFSINYFLLPLKISTGGVSGLATIFYYFFNVPLSITVFFVNIILFVMAYKKLPKSSLIKTAAGVVFESHPYRFQL